MAEIRRSGRQRTVSSRLKDMVTIKSTKGTPQNDDQDVMQDESGKQSQKRKTESPPGENIEAKKPKVLETIQEENTRDVRKEHPPATLLPESQCAEQSKKYFVTNAIDELKLPQVSQDDTAETESELVKLTTEECAVTDDHSVESVNEEIQEKEKNKDFNCEKRNVEAASMQSGECNDGDHEETKKTSDETADIGSGECDDDQEEMCDDDDQEESEKDSGPSSIGLTKNRAAGEFLSQLKSNKSMSGRVGEADEIQLIAEALDAQVTQNENGELLLSFGEETQPIQLQVKEEEDDVSHMVTIIPNITAEGFECSVEGCHYTTTRRVNWYKHQRVHTGTRSHPCDMCSYVAKTASNLKRHKMIHSNIKKFVCPFCEDTFRQNIHLKRHIRYKHETKRVQCGYCDYRCSSVNPDLRIHMKRRHLIHINEDAARVQCSCKECGFVAPSKKDLMQHMKFHRPGPELKLFCEHCSFVTDCPSRLNRHTLIHSKDRPYQCGLCVYRATQKQHVIRHMRSKHNIEGAIIPRTLPEATNPNLLEVLQLSTDPSRNEHNQLVIESPNQQGNQTVLSNETPVATDELPLDVSESIIPPTADIIRDGFRVLMDEAEESETEANQVESCEIENISEQVPEKPNMADPEEAAENTTKVVGRQVDTQPVTDDAVVETRFSETNTLSVAMVSLFQPSELAKDKIYPCPHCVMKFSKALNLYKHLEMQHKAIKDLSCCLCDYKTDKKANLLIHLRKHNMPRKSGGTSILKSTRNYIEEARSLRYESKEIEEAERSGFIQLMRMYKCSICQHTDDSLQNLYKHIEEQHAHDLSNSKGQDPATFCTVCDVSPETSKSTAVKDSEGGYQKVMVEMWPGSPAQLVDIEPPWRQAETNAATNNIDMLHGLQALANQASNSNVLTAEQVQAVCSNDQEKLNSIQVPTEQLMNLSSGDYIEIDGEMYKVEFSN